jgi:flagellar basal-body rod protein FlgF
MENSIYLGLSRQMVLRNNMTTIANNIANMTTPGYRGQHMLFSEYMTKPRGAEDRLSFVYDRGQYMSAQEGPMQQTENPFDVALVGQGFFAVQTQAGDTAYSRAGNFRLGQDGTLQTQAGDQVLDAGGAPIAIPAEASKIIFDRNGVISTEDGQIGQLQIVEFENIQELRQFGDNLYITDAAPLPPQRTTVQQGYLEGSNVNSILEMTNMIEVSRSYQSMQQALQQENERLRNAIQKLTRTG